MLGCNKFDISKKKLFFSSSLRLSLIAWHTFFSSSIQSPMHVHPSHVKAVFTASFSWLDSPHRSACFSIQCNENIVFACEVLKVLSAFTIRVASLWMLLPKISFSFNPEELAFAYFSLYTTKSREHSMDLISIIFLPSCQHFSF